MGVLTPYGAGPSPIWHGFGYILSKTFRALGALFGLLFLTALGIGIPWMKLWL